MLLFINLQLIGCDDASLCGIRSNLPSRHSYSLPTLNAEVVTDHTDCLSLRPAKPFVFRLPNFMYSLSHSYTDACVKEISASIIKVNFLLSSCLLTDVLAKMSKIIILFIGVSLK